MLPLRIRRPSPPARAQRRWRLAAAAVVTVAALGACGGDDGDASSSEPDVTEATDGAPAGPNGESTTVQAIDNSFRPDTVTVSVGTEVVFDNRGRNDHNVLPADGSDEWGVQAEAFHPGDVYAHVFLEPGEYAYYCSIHGTADVGMVGVVVVTG